MQPQHIPPFFRATALQRYLTQRERDILPRLVAPSIFLYCWLLSGILLGTLIMAWFIEVPILLEAPGIVEATPIQHSSQRLFTAIAFLSTPQSAPYLNPHHCRLRIGTITTLPCTLQHLSPQMLSPHTLFERFQFSINPSLLPTQPTLIAEVTFVAPPDLPDVSASRVSIQFQTGTQRLISLLPGAIGSEAIA